MIKTLIAGHSPVVVGPPVVESCAGPGPGLGCTPPGMSADGQTEGQAGRGRDRQAEGQAGGSEGERGKANRSAARGIAYVVEARCADIHAQSQIDGMACAHGGSQFSSTPLPHSVVSPLNCLMVGVLQPPKAVKSEKDGEPS